MSEDAAESIHAEMNALERRFACIHNLRERDGLMLQALEVSQNRKVVEGIKRRHRRRARKLKNGPYKNRGKKRKALAEDMHLTSLIFVDTQMSSLLQQTPLGPSRSTL
mgnify:CR=1 FL=1